MLKKKEKIIDIMNNPSMKLFSMLCGYLLLVLVLYTVFQFIKFENCLGITQILSVLIPILVYVYHSNKEKIKENIIIISIYLVLLLVVPFIWGYIPDLSCDGNMYHKVAVANIKNGWNPLYETTKEFENRNPNVVKVADESDTDLWIEHYPKGTWIVGASLYEMTGNIESGKTTSLFLLVMLLIISFNCLRSIIDKKWACFISLLICANPVMIAQIFTYYIDGLMGICFVIELLLLFLIKPMEKQQPIIWISLAAICSLYTNIKFTGLLCSGVLAAVFYFYWFFKHKKEKKFWLRFRNITLHFIAVFVTAIFLVGANSYIKNTVEHKNPLYPLFGDDKVDIITSQQPKSFKNKSSFEKFIISTFSKTDNIMEFMDKEPELKLPYQIYKSEINSVYVTDTRIGGFGPLYAMILIITLINLPFVLYLFIKNEKKNIKYIALPAIAVVLTMILVGEYWWARYVPQFYLFPLGTLVLLIYTSKYRKNTFISKLSTIVLTLVIIINICLFLPGIRTQLRAFIHASRELKYLKEQENPKIQLVIKDLAGHYYNLKDNNIEYTIEKNLTVENSEYTYQWNFFIGRETER